MHLDGCNEGAALPGTESSQCCGILGAALSCSEKCKVV